ncbi:hypothetical protein CEQ90_15280 [Lewinellaceae bacterium SD302]|nr:hypothetical protein CEQ90_15280 [Lewinellaceae bacterium SD302]
MYYRIFQLAICCTIFCGSCRQEPNHSAHRLLAPGPLAEQLLLEDPDEDYFHRVGPADLALQMLPLVFDTLVDTNIYRQWLAEQVIPWPATVRKRCDRLLKKAIREVEKEFTGLLPDSIFMVLLADEPYGEHIYFTRQNAIFVPLAEAEQASDQSLYTVFLHELFHLVSRHRPELRRALYAIANFVSAPERLDLDSIQHLPLLLNPDAPNYDYLLHRGDRYYLPVLFAREGKSDFSEALNYGYFEVVSLANKVAMSGESQGDSGQAKIVTNKRLPEHRIVEACEANSSYIIHPEEVLAEHFTLLFTAKKEELDYPEELGDLVKILQK